MSEKETMLVLAASYGSVEAAESDYYAVKTLYPATPGAHDFDAAVLERQVDGSVKVMLKHEQPTRHGAAKGLGWGLAIGAACAIFPPVGLLGGLVVGGGAGAVIGAVTGHVKGGLDDDDLKELGQVLQTGQAGLIAVYPADMAERVAASIKAQDKWVSKELQADAEELAKQIKAAGGTR